MNSGTNADKNPDKNPDRRPDTNPDTTPADNPAGNLTADPFIVTGAGGGIGGAVAAQLLGEGKKVIAVGRNLAGLCEKFSGYANCVCYGCDLSDEAEITYLIKTIVREQGAVRGLVHCAGFDKLSPLYLNKMDDVEALFKIHVFAPMTLCKLLSKRGNAAAGCSLVLISSLSAHEGAAGHTAYAAAKGALEGFLPTAACELAARDIRINIVVPGVIRTRMSQGFIGKMTIDQLESLNNSYPLGLGNPEDAAGMICFLLSEKAKWITGQKYIIDGGHMCRKA